MKFDIGWSPKRKRPFKRRLLPYSNTFESKVSIILWKVIVDTWIILSFEAKVVIFSWQSEGSYEDDTGLTALKVWQSIKAYQMNHVIQRKVLSNRESSTDDLAMLSLLMKASHKLYGELAT